MEEKKTNCIHCNGPLTGKQQKFCSERCSKRVRNKKTKKKYWKTLNAKNKTRKIERKLKRKFLIEQEIKRRENNKIIDD